MRIPATPCRDRPLATNQEGAQTPAPLQQTGIVRRFVRPSPLVGRLTAKPAAEACEEDARTPTNVPVRNLSRPVPLTRTTVEKAGTEDAAEPAVDFVAKPAAEPSKDLMDVNDAATSDVDIGNASAVLPNTSCATRSFRCPSTNASGQTAVGGLQGKTFGPRIRMMPCAGNAECGAASTMPQGKTLGARFRPGSCASDADATGPQPRKVFVRSVRSHGLMPLGGSHGDSSGTGTAAPQDADATKDFVLWEPPESDPQGRRAVKVDSQITKVLREHQRVGIQFIFDCLMGLKEAFNGFGCILADDMGLGKTLQSVAVMWALLTQGGPHGRPACHKALVVCPASLVKNWGRELDKWLGGRCKYTAVEVSGKAQVAGTIGSFRCSRESRVLIASYETFRGHAKEVSGCGIDLVLCDEAHKLKSDSAATTKCICALAATRRLLISGTPIQNNLEEFFTLVSIANPGIFGEAREFRKRYALPILRGREPTASPEERQLGEETLAAVSEVTEHFILRRTNKLNARFLPPKQILNVFVTPTEFQRRLYRSFLNSGVARKLLEAKNLRMSGGVLGTIMKLQLLVNHPFLVRNAAERINEGFDDAETRAMFEEVDSADAKLRVKVKPVHEELSGKLLLLHRMLSTMRNSGSGDRGVLVSNWTATLDLIQKMCEQYGWPVHRLDGSVSTSKRLKLVEDFNAADNPKAFIFLLSSKAGGCGLNLIGANRLIMYDPDWNPANDRQAMARIWRDGQKRTCYIYRLFTTGTIDEKVYQRQICKDGLSTMVVTEAGEEEPAEMKESLAAELVKDLFAYDEHTACATHDMLDCEHCRATAPSGGDQGVQAPEIAEVLEDDLLTWQHHRETSTVADTLLQEASKKLGSVATASAPRVSFTMTCTVEFTPEQIAKLDEEDQAAEQQRNKPERAAQEDTKPTVAPEAKPAASASVEKSTSKEMEAAVAPDLLKLTASTSAKQQRSNSEKAPDVAKSTASASAVQQRSTPEKAPDLAKSTASASAEQQRSNPEKAPDLAKSTASVSTHHRRSKSETTVNKEIEAAAAPDLAKPAALASACLDAAPCESSSAVPASATLRAAAKQSESSMPAATSICTKVELSNSAVSGKPETPKTASVPPVAHEILDLPVVEDETEVKSINTWHATSATMDDAILDLPAFEEDVRPKTRVAVPTIIDEILDSPVEPADPVDPVEPVEELEDAPPRKMRRLSPLGTTHEFDFSSVIAVPEDTCDGL